MSRCKFIIQRLDAPLLIVVSTCSKTKSTATLPFDPRKTRKPQLRRALLWWNSSDLFWFRFN